MTARTGRRTKDPNAYRYRSYRGLVDDHGLVPVQVRLRETDLHILAESDVSVPAGELVAACRLQIERYIDDHPIFATALSPLPEDRLAPPIVRQMLAAAVQAEVGPMAAVAGAIAEFVGRGLIEAGHKEIIVENGGDIFLQRTSPCTISVFAGRSSLSNRIGVRLMPEHLPAGICTSSGTIGHSMSLGQADAVTVIADVAAVADAAATRLGNEAGRCDNPDKAVRRVLAAAERVPGLRGVLVICAETMGAVGAVELVPLT